MITIIDIAICISCRDAAHNRGLPFDLNELQEEWLSGGEERGEFSDFVVNRLNALCAEQETVNEA